MKIKRFIFLFVFFSSIFFLHAENWTLAAKPFVLLTDIETIPKQNLKRSQEMQNLLPKLLLESFEKKISRESSVQEQIAKERYNLEVKKNSLYKDYEANIKKRDSYILEYQSKNIINQNIKNEEKKIKEIEQKIFGLEKEIKELGENKNGFLPKNKTIAIYNDGKELYNFTYQKDENENEKKAAIELDALSKNIDALISAEMEVNGDYLQLALHLQYFPNNLGSRSFYLVSSLSEISQIVLQMYELLLGELIQDNLVQLHFSVKPDEAKDQLVLHLDDEVYKKNFDKIVLPKKQYTVFAEAIGFEPLSFVYDFNQSEEYEIALKLKKIELHDIALDVKDKGVGFSLNAEDFGSFPITISLPKKQYLGQIVSDEWASFFILPEEDLAQPEQTLSYLNFSIEDKIKKSRNRLYFSYGAVLFALPMYIFSFAQYNRLLAASYYGLGTAKSIDFWNTFSSISFIAVSALGINMGVQLVFYLNDANKVIPK